MFDTADLVKAITTFQNERRCTPGQPMLVVVDHDELERRKDRRVPRS